MYCLDESFVWWDIEFFRWVNYSNNLKRKSNSDGKKDKSSGGV
jgi:hypothetical protein